MVPGLTTDRMIQKKVKPPAIRENVLFDVSVFLLGRPGTDTGTDAALFQEISRVGKQFFNPDGFF